MKQYILDAIGVTVVITFVLLALATIGTLLVSIAVPFFVLFPIVLLTKPAIERAAKKANDALTAWAKSKKTVPLD